MKIVQNNPIYDLHKKMIDFITNQDAVLELFRNKTSTEIKRKSLALSRHNDNYY